MVQKVASKCDVEILVVYFVPHSTYTQDTLAEWPYGCSVRTSTRYIPRYFVSTKFSSTVRKLGAPPAASTGYIDKHYILNIKFWMQQIGVQLARERAKDLGSATAQGYRPRRAQRVNTLGWVAATYIRVYPLYTPQSGAKQASSMTSATTPSCRTFSRALCIYFRTEFLARNFPTKIAI
jgi:hypothetical protein